MVGALRSTEEREKSTGRGSDKALVGEIGLTYNLHTGEIVSREYPAQ